MSSLACKLPCLKRSDLLITFFTDSQELLILLQERCQCWMHKIKAVTITDSIITIVAWNSLSMVPRQKILGAPALKVGKLYLQLKGFWFCFWFLINLALQQQCFSRNCFPPPTLPPQ